MLPTLATVALAATIGGTTLGAGIGSARDHDTGNRPNAAVEQAPHQPHAEHTTLAAFITPDQTTAAGSGTGVVFRSIKKDPHTSGDVEDPFVEGTISVAIVSYPGANTPHDAGDYITTLIRESVSPFWTDQLGARFSLNVAKVGNLKLTSGPCSQGNNEDTLRLPNHSMLDTARAQLGNDFMTSQHILFVWEKPSTYCGPWAGMAWVNPQPYQRGALWLNGLSRKPEAETTLIAHEFGHVFSLGHASTLGCVTEKGKLRTELAWGACFQEEYGSNIDVMGGTTYLGPISAAARIRAGLDDSLNTATINPSRASETTLLPLSTPRSARSDLQEELALPRAATLNIDGVSYTLEWRDGTGYDKPLHNRRVGAGVGVYLTATIRNLALLPVRDTDGTPWRQGDTFLLDGDTQTWEDDTTGYSRHLPLFRPVRLHNGAHLTVVETGSVAKIHYAPAGASTPVPPAPGAVQNLNAQWSRGKLHLSWQGNGSGTDFILQTKQPGEEWRNRPYIPVKPGQTTVKTTIEATTNQVYTRAGGKTLVRVAATNTTGTSAYVTVRVPEKPADSENTARTTPT